MNNEKREKYLKYQREYQRWYRQTNEKYQAWRREWAKARQRTHGKEIYAMRMSKPNERIAASLRSRIPNALRGKYFSTHTQELLGISLQGFKDYLEKKFTEGMNWKNYGKWHADHVVPLSKFDLSEEEELRKAFHYTNVQPLWAHQNLRKYAKV
jgi:hypothetical protein